MAGRQPSSPVNNCLTDRPGGLRQRSAAELSFVESGRFSGAGCRAADWRHVGRTKGRGKLDRRHERALPVKDVYLPCPLHADQMSGQKSRIARTLCVQSLGLTVCEIGRAHV